MKVFIFLLSLCFVNAQTIRVLDSQNGNPIQNVNIYVGNKGATTDKNGFCDLSLFNETDEITFSMIGYTTITLPFLSIPKVVYLKNESIPLSLVNVYGKNKKSRKRYNRLERDVRRVYPYAKKTSELLVEYSSIIDSLELYSGIKRYYKKRKIFSKIEDQLISKYGYSIKKLKKRQGRILIRLIDRETGKTSYNIIKDFRNIFSAGFWQVTARVFGHDLQADYNQNEGEDRIIEYIVNKIENEKSN